MAGLNDYAKIPVLVDGIFQLQITNISVNGNSGANAVETLEGLVGKTPGARQLEVSGTWAVPIGGLEFDVVTAVAKGTYHQVQIPVGTKTIMSRGWWETFGLSGSVGSNTEVTATFKGTLEPPQ